MPMPVAADVRVYLPELTGTGDDTAIAALLTSALAMASAWVGFPAADDGTRSLTVETYTLYLDGPREDVLRLPVRPVVSVTSLHDDLGRTYGASTLVDAADYELFGDEGVLLPVAGGGWSGPNVAGRRRYKAVVTAGWTALPPDLADAVVRLAAHLYRVRPTLGKSSLAQQGSSTGLRTEAMPASVRQILERYTVYAGLL